MLAALKVIGLVLGGVLSLLVTLWLLVGVGVLLLAAMVALNVFAGY